MTKVRENHDTTKKNALKLNEKATLDTIIHLFVIEPFKEISKEFHGKADERYIYNALFRTAFRCAIPTDMENRFWKFLRKKGVYYKTYQSVFYHLKKFERLGLIKIYSTKLQGKGSYTHNYIVVQPAIYDLYKDHAQYSEILQKLFKHQFVKDNPLVPEKDRPYYCPLFIAGSKWGLVNADYSQKSRDIRPMEDVLEALKTDKDFICASLYLEVQKGKGEMEKIEPEQPEILDVEYVFDPLKNEGEEEKIFKRLYIYISLPKNTDLNQLDNLFNEAGIIDFSVKNLENEKKVAFRLPFADRQRNLQLIERLENVGSFPLAAGGLASQALELDNNFVVEKVEPVGQLANDERLQAISFTRDKIRQKGDRSHNYLVDTHGYRSEDEFFGKLYHTRRTYLKENYALETVLNLNCYKKRIGRVPCLFGEQVKVSTWLEKHLQFYWNLFPELDSSKVFKQMLGWNNVVSDLEAHAILMSRILKHSKLAQWKRLDMTGKYASHWTASLAEEHSKHFKFLN